MWMRRSGGKKKMGFLILLMIRDYRVFPQKAKVGWCAANRSEGVCLLNCRTEKLSSATKKIYTNVKLSSSQITPSAFPH